MFKDHVFEQAFEKAELANFGPAEMSSYEHSLKTYRDLKGAFDTAYDDGKIEGKLEVAKALKNTGAAIELIMNVTGFSQSDIDRL